MIILTHAQANQIRGETTDGNALDPIALADGVTFVLPEAVLSDPAHQSKRAFLTGLPKRSIAPNEWVQSS